MRLFLRGGMQNAWLQFKVITYNRTGDILIKKTINLANLYYNKRKALG